MRGEVLDASLPSRAMRGHLVKWQPALLQYQTGLVAIRNDLGLDDGLIVLSGRHGHQQPSRGATGRAGGAQTGPPVG